MHVLVLAASGWHARAEGRNEEAVKLVRAAADLEDSTEKHVAMENRLYPMREMLGDLRCSKPASRGRRYRRTRRRLTRGAEPATGLLRRGNGGEGHR